MKNKSIWDCKLIFSHVFTTGIEKGMRGGREGGENAI
jgi:hypothetical protein